MDTQTTFDQVDEIALKFAQGLVSTNHNKQQINQEAIDLAIDWVLKKDEREQVYNANFAKWELLDKKCKFAFNRDQSYWVAYEEAGEMKVGQMEFNEVRSSYQDFSHSFIGADGLGYQPKYFINPENAQSFSATNKPKPPVKPIIKPTFSYKNI